MKKLFKKYICLAFVMLILVIALCISYTVDEINISELVFKYVYAAETKESSTSTKQSSTSTTKSEKSETENSDDMLDLLARVINAEARGEPYLRSSSSWSCNYEQSKIS